MIIFCVADDNDGDDYVYGYAYDGGGGSDDDDGGSATTRVETSPAEPLLSPSSTAHGTDCWF